MFPRWWKFATAGLSFDELELVDIGRFCLPCRNVVSRNPMLFKIIIFSSVRDHDMGGAISEL
jgi:hypothetical protein